MGRAGTSTPAAENSGGSFPDDDRAHLRRHQRPLPARSWGTGAVSGGPSLSTTSGSAGSPSAERNDHGYGAAATPASDCTYLRFSRPDGPADDDGLPDGGKKRKRVSRVVGPDKGGRGLRQFSMKVCEKVESKVRTTYNEVANELVTEYADPNNALASPDQQQQYDEKNIRRRVYDALNVLMAMDIISKDKKEIQWKGLPCTTLDDLEELKTERNDLKNSIDKKSAYLRELEDQLAGLQKLIQRNQQLCDSGHSSSGVALPFILIKTRPQATVEVEISEDMQLVHFDFKSTPFELHDDEYVLRAMNSGEAEQHANGGEDSSKQTVPQSDMPNSVLSVPGILKGRLKHELFYDQSP